jgi:hypothetical protein
MQPKSMVMKTKDNGKQTLLCRKKHLLTSIEYNVCPVLGG